MLPKAVSNTQLPPQLQKDEEEKEGATAPTLSDTETDRSGSTLPCLAVADWAKRSPTPERETAPSKAEPKMEGAEMAEQKKPKLPLPTEIFISFEGGKGSRKRGRSITKRRTFEMVKGKVSRCELPDLSSSSEGEGKKDFQGNLPASSSSASATQRETPP